MAPALDTALAVALLIVGISALAATGSQGPSDSTAAASHIGEGWLLPVGLGSTGLALLAGGAAYYGFAGTDRCLRAHGKR